MKRSNNYKYLRTIVFIGMIFLFVGITPLRTDAKTTIISRRTSILGEYDNTSVSVKFTLTKRQILQMPIQAITMNGDVESGGLRIQLKNVATGQIIQNDFMSWESFGSYENDIWYYSDGYYVNPGTYTYTLINSCPDDSEVKWGVFGFDGFAQSVKFNGKKKLKSGNWHRVGTIKNASNLLPLEKSVSSSKNSRIHKNDVLIDALGRIYVYAHKPGKVKITIKMMNGKKFKKTFTVTSPEPNFTAELMSYNTRKNYIKVKFKNKGIGTVKIKAGGAKLLEDHYKSFDRTLSNSTYTIKSGKSKTVKFYIDGDTTWPLIKDYEFYYYFTYYGKTFKGHANIEPECSSYKKKKKWYNTYWGDFGGEFEDD